MSFPMPDPPMALYPDWEDWREEALQWITYQIGEWTADDLRDAHGVEYAKSGIQQNTEEIDALTTDYNELKEACK